MTRFVLVNPNTSAATTATMVAIARAAAPGVAIEGLTVPFGAPLIIDEAALAQAARAVLALAPELCASPCSGVIVAAFGDPGLSTLRPHLACPVTGIAEAGMAEAGADGRRFAVVTTTPALADAIGRSAGAYGHATNFAGTWLTPGDPVALMSDPDRLTEALGEACVRARDEGGAEAIVIGGGPLALAARALSGRLNIPIVEPVPAAMRLALQRADRALKRISP